MSERSERMIQHSSVRELPTERSEECNEECNEECSEECNEGVQ